MKAKNIIAQVPHLRPDVSRHWPLQKGGAPESRNVEQEDTRKDHVPLIIKLIPLEHMFRGAFEPVCRVVLARRGREDGKRNAQAGDEWEVESVSKV